MLNAEDEVISIKEVAARFGVTPQTIRNWEKQGLIASFRTLGKHRRYRRIDVEKLLERAEKENQ